MPDADGFQPRLPEQARLHPHAPANWGQAFACTPQEAPDAGGWQRLQARLPSVPARRARWPAWGALAASLTLAVAIPVHLRPDPGAASPAMPLAESTRTAAPTDAPGTAVTTTPAALAASTSVALPVAAGIPATAQAAGAPASAQRTPVRTPRTAPERPSIRSLAPHAGTAMLASATPPLDELQGQSAQLEGLLALARDERVSSGTSAALSSDLDARVASIDASLVQPDLDPTQRAALWSERVEALQQLVGIETTNRLYAARGQTFDVALVSVD
jgi:hypothetical protein